MTVVVGLRTNRGVLLAGDSQYSSEWSNRKLAGGKVHQLYDTVAVAYCGSGRFGQLLQYELLPQLEEPSLVMDEEYWAVREFIPELRDVFESHGHLHVKHNMEHFGPSGALLAVRGRLFEVEADFAVTEHRLVYSALGSGEDKAMGAFFSELNTEEKPVTFTDARVEEIAEQAVLAAAEFDNFVGGPVTYAWTTLYTPDEKKLARKILAKRR